MWRTLVIVLMLGLSACAVAPRVEGPGAVIDPSTLLQWQAGGRIGVSSAAGGGSGSFTWEQRDARTLVQVSGPVGVGSFRFSIDGSMVSIETSDGQRLESDAALQELQARLGADVPAAKLRYWLLGVAAPGEHRWLSEPTQLEQDGWLIEYRDFTQQSGFRLPARINATSGDARVRLVISRWRLGEGG